MDTTTTTERYVVLDAATTPSGRCWGVYRRVAVVELEPGYSDIPKMISARAKGVKRVVETWENCNVGKTERCAYERAMSEAYQLAARLNGEQP